MIGVFGGTFDPVHFGHLRPALELLEGLGLEEVRMIPCRRPPHRGLPQATPAQRLAMLKAGVGDTPGLRVDDRELRREGPSYMVDTLASLRGELGDTRLCLLLGMDALAGLASWHDWRTILELAHLVVAHRPGWTAPEAGEIGELVRARRSDSVDALRAEASGRILFRPVTQLEISASGIRGLLTAGRSPRFLLPDAVLAIIEREGIYRTQD